MDTPQARELLVAGTAYQRLLAARRLVRDPGPEDLALIKERLVHEQDNYVRRVLALGVDVANANAQSTLFPGPATPTLQSPVDPDGDEIQDSHSLGPELDYAANLLVHELRPLVGLLKIRAAKELQDYAKTDTAKHIAQIGDFLSALDQLADAGEPFTPEGFDVQKLLVDLVESELAEPDVHVALATPAPMEAMGSGSLLRLALRNAIRNAIESTRAAGEPFDDVVVSWGETDKDYWVAVLDRGVGLPARRSKMLELGSSTKKGHRGIGLTIASRAAASLGGTVHLDDRAEGGVRFEIRWTKGNPPG